MSQCDPTCTPETCEHYSPVEACRDCLILIANGESPDDCEDLGDIIAARWVGFWLALGCPETCCERNADGESPDPWFSWSSCEVCGSNQGGNREHVTPFKIKVKS